MDGNINNMGHKCYLDYDIESHILEDLNDFSSKECAILSDKENSKFYKETSKVVSTIIDNANLKKWVDNTHSNLPPDFINEKDGLLLEIMRIDDHSPDGKKNPYKAKARKAIKKLDLGINARIITSIPTNLPTDEDHNYKNLYTAFQRVIRKHLEKLEMYKSNHPNKKIIFLVLNETSGNYFEIIPGTTQGKIHLIFYDNRFLNEFINSKLDYLILYSPYNYFETVEKHYPLPRMVAFDVKRLKRNKYMQFIDYDEANMKSSEI